MATQYNDLLIGDNRSNKLFGLEGDDIIRGAGGDDYIVGAMALMNCTEAMGMT